MLIRNVSYKRIKADLGRSSRPPLPIQTLLEDKEDGEDYSEVIEVLKHLNTLKASVEDSVSAIKNISSTLASLTNSSNAATTGKTSYSPRFDPFSGTIDVDSPPHPPRKEPHLGPAINSATSNLDPPTDTGSKEGFKDTITSSIVKELSKKAYTIPDDSKLSGESNFEQWIQALKSKKEDVYNEFHALTFSTYKKGLLAFNAEFNSYLAKLTIAKIDIDPSLILNQNPATEAYRAAHIANSSNSTPNSNSNPSKKGKNKKKGKKKASYNVKGQNYSAKSAEQASFMLGSYNLAIEKEEESDSSSNSSSSSDSDTQLAQLLALKGYKKHHISNSKERFTTFTPNIGQLRPINTGNGPISPAGIGSITLEVLSRKAPPTYTKLRNKIVVEIPSNSIRKEDYRPIIEDAIVSEAIEPNKRYKLRNSPAKGTTLEGLGPSLRGKRPFIEGNKVVEKAISSPTLKEPNIAKRGIKFSTSAPYIYEQNGLVERSVRVILDLELVNSIAITNKETTPFQALFDELKPGILYIPNLERYRAIGARGEAIIPLEKRSKSLKFTSRTEECKLLAVLGSKTYLVYIPSRRAVLKTSTVKFIEDNTVLSQPTNNTALEGELVDLDLDLEGAVSLDPFNLNTKKPISIEIGPSKLEPYKSSSDSKLDEPLPDKPINPVIVESTRPTISIRKPELPEVFPQTIEPILAPKPIEVIAPNQPITNEPLDNSDLISEGDKMQLDYYKLLAKTIAVKGLIVYNWVIEEGLLEEAKKQYPIALLELGVFKFLLRSLLPSNRKLITCRNVLKVKKDAKNRPIKYKSRLVAKGFIQVEGLDYTVTYASTSIPPTWRILLAIGAVLDWEIEQADFIGAFLNSALREEIYMEIPKGLLDLAASNKAIYKLLLKYGYNPSTPNIIKLSKALYRVFYNAKTYYFIVTYVDDCPFIGPNIGYITDLKKRLNKVYAIEDLGPAAYFLGLSRSLNRPTKSHLNAAKNLFKYLNSTKDYSICFSCNGNTVANPGPKLSNSSNTTTKLSRDFHSKEGPRPLTTTSTTIVDSRNSQGSSRTSIINSSLVPIGFSDSDFTGDKATSKSTYGYLYKLAEAIREVQWIIGLFSKLHRPIDYLITLYGDNQGSITVANDPALHARTKHTLLKFRYVREQVKAKLVTIIVGTLAMTMGHMCWDCRLYVVDPS
ncbi:hypothetical protein P8C59_004252 [Phyllachora maydis]|uniref:Reverse transcriptase Ty1/copia-type domain-containing protein n=1 Tax=Phyllachora maydis TaxID=1825666 RepID=A0AAD9I1W6_9PEZI|nr:hypothetical protein P8C59_004252 [Phyllachora maydis]